MIRVAVLGAGIGRAHLDGFARLADRFQVAAVGELDRRRGEEALSAAGIRGARVERDVDALIDDGSIDLVDICLPPHLHCEVALAALAAGKDVVVEKPLATSLRDVDRIAEAAAAAGRRVFPVFQYRYGRAARALDALLAAGLLGEPLAAALEIHWDRRADYYAPAWRGTWKGEMGGAVLGHAIHAHDLLCRHFGKPAAIQATTATRANPIEVEDCAAIAFELESGALATSSITLGAAGDTTRLRFCFSKLTAESATAPYAPMAEDWRFIARDPAEQPAVDRIVRESAAGLDGFLGFFDAVADAIHGAPGRAVTLDDGRASIELVSAIYQAARFRAAASPPIGSDHPLYGGWAPE